MMTEPRPLTTTQMEALLCAWYRGGALNDRMTGHALAATTHSGAFGRMIARMVDAGLIDEAPPHHITPRGRKAYRDNGGLPPADVTRGAATVIRSAENRFGPAAKPRQEPQEAPRASGVLISPEMRARLLAALRRGRINTYIHVLTLPDGVGSPDRDDLVIIDAAIAELEALS